MADAENCRSWNGSAWRKFLEAVELECLAQFEYAQSQERLCQMTVSGCYIYNTSPHYLVQSKTSKRGRGSVATSVYLKGIVKKRARAAVLRSVCDIRRVFGETRDACAVSV